MDAQALSELFATTYNPDPNVRKSAELQIRALTKEPGMIGAVMQIVGAEGLDISVRQACAVWLKNRVDRSYFINPDYPRPDQITIESVDRASLKNGILQLIVSAPSRPIRSQLAEILRLITMRDYPDEWPGYAEGVSGLLHSKNPNEVYAGLLGVAQPVKAFRYRTETKTLETLLNATLGSMLQIGQDILNNGSTTNEAAEFLATIFKTYRNSLLQKLLPCHSNNILPWGRLLLGVASLQVTVEEEDPEEREKTEWWRAKKWAYASLNLLFTSYGNPSQMPGVQKAKYGDFAKQFVSTFAPEILKIYVQQVDLNVSQKVWLSRKVIYKILQFFNECVKPKSTWELLKPQFYNIVSAFVFPQLSFTDYKKGLWRDDPVDYLRVTIDEYEDYQSPTSAASTFLLTLATVRTKATFIPMITFIQSVLTGDGSTPEQKFGGMSMIVSLASVILRHPNVKPNLDQFLLVNVLPILASEYGFLRAAGCEAIAALEHHFIEWQNSANLAHCYNAIVQLLDDPDTPVRVHAALALSDMIRHEYVRDGVKQIIGKILQTFIELSEATELDILTSTLSIWVDNYSEEILPVALQLTQRLAGTYLRTVQELVALENNKSADQSVNFDDADEKVFAASALLKTIGSIVTAMDHSKEILNQIQQTLIPLIHLTLEHCIIDLLDGVFDLIDSLTFNLQTIDAAMWPIFELTYKQFKANALDFLEEMLPSLDNYLSYGKETFFNRPDYCEMILDMYEVSMTDTHLGENDAVVGCNLIESFLLNLRGRVDFALSRVIACAVKFIDPAPKTKALRLGINNVLVNCILYNAPAAFHILETTKPGLSRVVFDQWFKIISEEKGLPRVHDMKLSILALCGLLELDENNIPQDLKAGWTSIITGALTIFKGLPAAIGERKRQQENLETMEEPDDYEDFDAEANDLHLEDDEDDVWDEDDAIREVLAQSTEKNRKLAESANRTGTGGESGSDSDGEIEDDLEEDLGFISPLDTVDPYLAFKRSLTILQMKNPAVHQAATTSLSMDQGVILVEVMAAAERKEQEVGPIQI